MKSITSPCALMLVLVAPLACGDKPQPRVPAPPSAQATETAPATPPAATTAATTEAPGSDPASWVVSGPTDDGSIARCAGLEFDKPPRWGWITPTMNFLAGQGATLDRFYTAPWCAPSRSALMTGIMPHLGMQGIATAVPKHVTFISEVMKEAGYSTHHVGKWHLGMTRLWQYPTSRGFDSSFGFMDGQADYVTQMCQEGNGGARSSWACQGVDLQSDGRPALGRNGTFAMDWFKGHATYPIKNRADPTKPLFLFVAMQAMHTPSPGPETLRQPVVPLRMRRRPPA